MNRISVATCALIMALLGHAGAATADAEANKALVRDYMTKLLVEKQVEQAVTQYADPNLIQHNPYIADGSAAVIGFLGNMLEQNPGFRYDIKRMIAEDDLVAIHAHVTFAPEDPGMAAFDLFRVKDGKVVEHWDVLQPVPEQSANGNSMF